MLQFSVPVGLLALLWPGWILHTASGSDDAQAQKTNSSQSSPADKKACLIPDCKEIAAKFLSRIDTTVNPCDDFYQYSCGKWIKAKNDQVGEFRTVDERNKGVVKKLLKGDVKPAGPAFEAEKKMKNLYKQCISTDEIEKLRGTPIIKILSEFNGGWPMITPNWDASKFNVFGVLVKNHFFGNDPFFSVSVGVDAEQPTINRVVLDSMTPFADTDILLDPVMAEKYTMDYLASINNAAKLLLRDNKQPENTEVLSPKIIDIARLEERLTAVELKNDSITLNKFTLKTFKNHHKFKSTILRNITGYLQAYFAVANQTTAITDDTVVIVPTLRYWDKLDQKLAELEKQGVEGRRRMANYIGFKLIYSVLKYLSKEYRDIVENPSSIEDKCMSIIKSTMPLALGTLYVRDVVPKDLKKKATLMVNDIHVGFKELLDEAKWMDKTTYEGAIKKLAAIEEIVAYPDIMLTNTSAIDSYFATMTIQPTFLRSILQTQRNNLIRDLQSITQPHLRYDPLKDTDDITIPGAFYSTDKNQLILLAGILDIPFFKAEAPQYLNYGGIGYIIAHEITHGFDTTGANYDPNGAHRLWWTNTTFDEYKRRAKSIAQQYNKYRMPTGKVNGELTLTENIADNGGLRAAIADNGGLRAALKGYSRYLARPDTKELLPPGLEDYTPMQLFFLSSAQVWCLKIDPDKERLYLLIDYHSPNKWRVNGPMSNLPEFAQSFNCSLGSKMNPKIKNRVW